MGTHLKTVINELEKIIFKQFELENTGHDWHHINRVRKLACFIQSKEGGEKEVIEIAALLHDISDHKFNGGDFLKGGQKSEEILLRLGVDSNIIEHVKTIVNNVSFKGAKLKSEVLSLEGKIVQDADRLDAIGAIGIARTFAYGGHIGQPIYNPDVPPTLHQIATNNTNGKTHTINHFYEKLLLLKDKMHTPTAKKIAEERHQLMKTFLTQFYDEWTVKTPS